MLVLTGLSAGLVAASSGFSASYTTTYSPYGTSTTVSIYYDPGTAFLTSLLAFSHASALDREMENDRLSKEIGYLRKETVYPQEGISG